jgi:hypothetical protein
VVIDGEQGVLLCRIQIATGGKDLRAPARACAKHPGPIEPSPVVLQRHYE